MHFCHLTPNLIYSLLPPSSQLSPLPPFSHVLRPFVEYPNHLIVAAAVDDNAEGIGRGEQWFLAPPSVVAFGGSYISGK